MLATNVGIGCWSARKNQEFQRVIADVDWRALEKEACFGEF